MTAYKTTVNKVHPKDSDKRNEKSRNNRGNLLNIYMSIAFPICRHRPDEPQVQRNLSGGSAAYHTRGMAQRPPIYIRKDNTNLANCPNVQRFSSPFVLHLLNCRKIRSSMGHTARR